MFRICHDTSHCQFLVEESVIAASIRRKVKAIKLRKLGLEVILWKIEVIHVVA